MDSNLTVAIIFSILAIGRIYFKIKTKSFFDTFKGKDPMPLVIYRVVLGIILAFVIIIYGFYDFPSWMKVDFGPIISYIGTAIAIFSISLIFWAHIALGDNFTTVIGKAYKLVKEGPYAYIRHPIYVGYMLLFASVTLINGWWVMSIIGMSIILSLIIWRLPLEEKYLEEKFGKEYIEYVEKTPRFFPKIPKFMIQYKKSKS